MYCTQCGNNMTETYTHYLVKCKKCGFLHYIFDKNQSHMLSIEDKLKDIIKHLEVGLNKIISKIRWELNK